MGDGQIEVFSQLGLEPEDDGGVSQLFLPGRAIEIVVPSVRCTWLRWEAVVEVAEVELLGGERWRNTP